MEFLDYILSIVGSLLKDYTFRWCMGGVLSYIILTLYVEKNRIDNGGKPRWKKIIGQTWDEWVITFLGGLLFFKLGDGVFTVTCIVVNKLGLLTEEVCTDIYIYVEELLYFLGGFLFGTTLALMLRVIKNVLTKKLIKWQRKNS